MLQFSKKEEYKPNDLVIVIHKGAQTVFKLRKVDSIAQTAEAQRYRGKVRDVVIFGSANNKNKIDIPLSAIIRKATQQEITKAELENKTR
jgi:hypothetical protein